MACLCVGVFFFISIFASCHSLWCSSISGKRTLTMIMLNGQVIFQCIAANWCYKLFAFSTLMRFLQDLQNSLRNQHQWHFTQIDYYNILLKRLKMHTLSNWLATTIGIFLAHLFCFVFKYQNRGLLTHLKYVHV